MERSVRIRRTASILLSVTEFLEQEKDCLRRRAKSCREGKSYLFIAMSLACFTSAYKKRRTVAYLPTINTSNLKLPCCLRHNAQSNERVLLMDSMCVATSLSQLWYLMLTTILQFRALIPGP